MVPNEGSNKKRKRVGRGTGSGHGKTSGRGTKGQKSRSGPGVRLGFEGGQLPIQKRMPYKRGFTNIYKTQWEVVNLGAIEEFGFTDEVTPETLYERGVIRGLEFPVKILGNGELTTKLSSFRSRRVGVCERADRGGRRFGDAARADRSLGHRPSTQPGAADESAS